MHQVTAYLTDAAFAWWQAQQRKQAAINALIEREAQDEATTDPTDLAAALTVLLADIAAAIREREQQERPQ